VCVKQHACWQPVLKCCTCTFGNARRAQRHFPLHDYHENSDTKENRDTNENRDINETRDTNENRDTNEKRLIN
jgi:hypothetical protein